MINPTQIQQKAKKHYLSFLSSVIIGKEFFPIEFPVGSIPTANYLDLQKSIIPLMEQSKEKLGYGYTLDKETRKTKKYGLQTLPKRISIDTEANYLKFIKKEKEFIKFKADLELILLTIPELKEWLYQNPLKVIEYSDRWIDLLKVCQYFQKNPQPNLYIRELPIPVHTKFIEHNKGILRNLLEFILPSEFLTSVEGEKGYIFEKRFSLKYPEPLIRFRVLDRTLKYKYNFSASDMSVLLSEFNQLNLANYRFFITENLMNFLTLPALENSLALFGKGYAIQTLKSIDWLKTCPIYYWGDLDPDGFKILSQLRSFFPQTISLMMDLKTFETFQEFAVKVTKVNVSSLPNLTPEEQALYSYLSLHQKRLEQEHISQVYAEIYLQNLV